MSTSMYITVTLLGLFCQHIWSYFIHFFYQYGVVAPRAVKIPQVCSTYSGTPSAQIIDKYAYNIFRTSGKQTAPYINYRFCSWLTLNRCATHSFIPAGCTNALKHPRCYLRIVFIACYAMCGRSVTSLPTAPTHRIQLLFHSSGI